jgi:ADP-ribose pyrophosphatase YjhB (NUDIX family)
MAGGSMIRDTPKPTTDIIIEYGPGRANYIEHDGSLTRVAQDGIILIKRLHAPHGWALPGGFAEVGLTFEQNARKEAKEETNLDVLIYDIEQPFRVQSDPQRDPRKDIGQITSNVYIAEGQGLLRAGDDAKSVYVRTVPQVRALVEQDKREGGVFAFSDHRRAIEAYLDRRLFLEDLIIHCDGVLDTVLQRAFYSNDECAVYLKRYAIMKAQL